MSADRYPVSRNAATTQAYLLHLFGDTILPYNEGAAWTEEILYLLQLLGVTERAGRSALTRMKKKGWLEAERIGRRSRYALTPAGKAIIVEQNRRLAENPVENWDGSWHLVVYSLPEVMRGLRGDLRRELTGQGFGQLTPGSWISAHDRSKALERFAVEMGIRPYVALFSGRQSGLITDEEIVTRSWDLTALANGYLAYIDAWQLRLVSGDLKPAALNSPEDRFWARFLLTFDFAPLAHNDPHLPAVLLPQDWPGYTARRLLTYYRVQLNEDLPEYFETLFQ